MVEGAEAWRDAKPGPGPLIGPVEGGAVAAAALLLDVVPAPSAGELAALVGCGPGSKGGRTIRLPAVGGMLLTVWGVINCRF
jgi:hypothetical protein